MDRRGREIASRLTDHIDAEILAAPSGWTMLSRCVRWNAAYIIDPGRRGLLAAVIARSLGMPTLVEIGDPQGDLYRAEGRSLPAVGIGRFADALVVRTASGVIFRGAELAAVLHPKVPWTYIPDGVDLGMFTPQPGDDTRRRLGIPVDALVVGLVGNIHWSEPRQSAYGLDVVSALVGLADLPVWALIVGGGDGVAHLRERANALGVQERIVFTGPVPHAKVPGLLCAMDVCVSTQSNDAIGRGRTTAKLPEYLACDRFVLSTPVGTAATILPSEMLMEHGESGDPSHHARLATRLRDLYGLRDRLHRGAGTRELAAIHFSYDSVAAQFLEFLQWVARS
jgi:glycosyltransferase involved in cell wall biosynthesis